MTSQQPSPPSPPSGPAPAQSPFSAPPSTSGTPSLLNFDALFNNPLFSGGIGLAVFGTGLAVARRSLIIVSSRVKKSLLIDLEIPQTDDSYQWFLRWMARQHQQLLVTPPKTVFDRLSRRLVRVHHLSADTLIQKGENGGIGNVRAFAAPGYGRHILRYQEGFFAVDRERKNTANTKTGQAFETVKLTTLYAHRHLFESMFREIFELATAAQVGKTMMYTPRFSEWVPRGEPKIKRPLSSVILDEGIEERILTDVRDFTSRQQWYVERGIPYRRGYLLYGPPGTGKSSFVQALASELDYGIALMSLSQRGLTDDALDSLLNKVPARTIVLLEDADAAFINKRKMDGEGYSGGFVTFSGLLNALDGVAAGEERIVFLTTNHIEKLDAALIRPGRIDMMVRIGEATRYQAGAMWDRFYGDVDEDCRGRERFLARLEELGLIEREGSKESARLKTSTAAIQGLFLFNKDDMEGAINMVEGLIPRVHEPELSNAA